MERDNARPTSPIWLLADSPPSGHKNNLDEPLDWRFPTRHNIWTPIETVINRELYRDQKIRIDDSKFYARNAVESSETWKDKNKLDEEISEFSKLAELHRPFLICTFGQRAFEFARRSQTGSQKEDKKPFSHWNVITLSDQFNKRLSFDLNGVKNLVPLLHAVIAQQYQYCHENFRCGQTNYFEHVGGRLATILKQRREDKRFSELWM